MTRSLGRNTPADFSHVEAAPLHAASQLLVPKPVTIGVNWYEDFDQPRQTSDGSWHLPEAHAIRGQIRGGHCITLGPMGFMATPDKVKFIEALWRYYNQGPEGACEGFGHAHAQSIEVGGLYDGFRLYDDARKIEGTFPSGEGTTNHAAVQALQNVGIAPQPGTECQREYKGDATYVKPVTDVRWTKDAQEVLTALGRLNAAAIPLLNSWGLTYPCVVWLPVTTLARLLEEDGEADCCTG